MIVDRLAHVMGGGAAESESEFRIIDKGGGTKWVRSISVRIDWKGSPAALMFLNDVTAVKITEEEIRRLQVQLIKAQKMEALGALAGGIAHDFNNVLGAIMGYSEIVKLNIEEGAQDDANRNIEQVLKASHRAKDLANQILAFSRRDSFEEKQVQVSSIAEEVLQLLRASIPSTVEIRSDIEKGSGLTVADSTKMHQVFMNLCTNAAHAMRMLGGVMQVSVSDVDLDREAASQHPDLKPGPYVRVTVSDTGHGMPPEVLEHVFEPYFTTKEKDVGTGLGLSVVHASSRATEERSWCTAHRKRDPHSRSFCREKGRRPLKAQRKRVSRSEEMN